MKQNLDKVMPWVFEEEGGYVDHTKDPGGATNYGITHRTLAAWRGKSVTKQDVKNLSKKEAQEIYRSEYWRPIRGDDLPSGLDYAVFDFCINSGPKRAVQELQRIVGVRDDGIIGKHTLEAVSRFGVTSLIDKYMNARLAFLKRLSTWSTFGKGWTNRVERVRKRSKSLVGLPVQDVPKPVVEAPVHEPEGAPPKAREEDKSLADTMKKPEVMGPILGTIAGFGSVVVESEPIQYALAFGLLVCVLYGVYWVVQKERGRAH